MKVEVDYKDLENTIGRLLRTTSLGVAELNGHSATLTSDSKYARVHEYGATITAKNVPYLKFQYQGRWVTKSSVKIPPRPIMNPAVQDSVEEVQKILANTIAMAATATTPEQVTAVTTIELRRAGEIVLNKVRKNAIETLYSQRGLISGHTGKENTGALAESMRVIYF